MFPPQLPDHGLPVDYDELFFQYETQIPYDENAAEHLLRIIIYYLETNKPLPYGIRDYLYRAFKETICAEPSKRPSMRQCLLRTEAVCMSEQVVVLAVVASH